MQNLLATVQPHDMVRLSINSPGLDHEIWLPFMKPAQLTADRIMIEAERVLQSKKEWLLEGNLLVKFIHAPLPVGGGRVKRTPDAETYLKKKHSIISIPKSKDNLCCAKAIITAKAKLDKHPKWESIKRGRKIQQQLAEELQRVAGIPYGTLCGRVEWDKFQKVLGNDYELIVISRDFFNAIVYNSLTQGSKKVILYHADQHFSVITSMTAFMGRSYYCTMCNTPYNNPGGHKCDLKCSKCQASKKCVFEAYNVCDACHRVFVSNLCLQNHRVNGLCSYIQSCPSCGKTYHTYRKHKCGYAECKQCRKVLPIDHKCYIQPLPHVKPKPGHVYIFYDFECMLDETHKHVPNLCVAHRVCQDCMEVPMSEHDCGCGRCQVIFRGENTLEDFGSWLFSGEHVGAICIAHNAQAYDLHLLMDYVHKHGIKPALIQNGKKILCMEAFDLKFIDSLNFFPMSLAKLPKAFGLSELAKGFFPHLFNTSTNQNYVGDMPNIKYYDPDGMKSEKRNEFMNWYATQTHFDFQRHLENYCKSDVDILQRCCGKFRTLFMTYTEGIEPFLKSITIASATNEVFRTMFLEPQQIAILPTHGYYGGNQSAIALCWMDHLSQLNNIHIQHAKNGGEVKVEGWRMDGVDENNVLYAFHGCFWHGCENCYPDRTTVNPVSQLTMNELRQRTLLQTEILRKKGYTVIEKWECDFKADMAQNANLTEFYEGYKIHESLQPRDSFFGGRTNATRLFYESNDNEQIRYVDFTSLYPYVCKYGIFPVGHPEISFGNDIPNDVFGILKCKILPPQDLIHPVLPYRTRNKLTFPLCRTCAEQNHQALCPHALPEERALIGTWVTIEIDKALSLGYKIMEKYEAWHFPSTTQYDPSTKTGGVWSQCIDLWLKQKQQASDWPTWCVTDEDKQQYISDYEKHEGITLEPDQIEKNEGLRSLAKLMLNSMWGKMGQNPNKSKMTYVSDPVEYVKMMTDDSLEITDLIFVNDEHIALRWNQKSEFVESLPNTNVVLAAFTTAHARLKLYRLLEQLQNRVLYFDTDSVIYIHNESLWNPPLGDYLGELKDETNGIPIKTFVSGGAKNYAYTLEDGASVCKIRGFTLNHRNSLALNIQTMKHLVTTNESSQPVITNPFKIVRKDGQLFTKSESKAYQIVYNKRVLGNHFMTYPFGYK
jgi:hypothetical protein